MASDPDTTPESVEPPAAPAAVSPPAAPPQVMAAAPVAGTDPPRRTFKQRIDDHPVGLLLAMLITAVTATIGIIVPVLQQTQDSRVAAVEAELAQARAEQVLVTEELRVELAQARRETETAVAEERARGQARIDELERSLSSITRTLGDGTDYFDVRRLVVDARDASAIPPTSRYEAADRFYALDPDQATGWTRTTITDLELSAGLFGMTEAEYRERNPAVSEAAWENATRFPIHVWYYGDDRKLEFTDPANGAMVTFHPRTIAMVQRVSHADYLTAALSQFPSASEEATAILRSSFARDPAGWALQDRLLNDLAFGGTFRARVESLQKGDDIGYGRLETVFPDVTVDGQQYPEYFWGQEWLVVDSGSDLYLVRLWVADDDHRSPDYSAVSTWLDALRIVRA
ncbi:MAG: hypothetical protein KF809_03235 [Chloroflexi bacterium]|nr:hypothetical protein [Chloroflexota bacterium]